MSLIPNVIHFCFGFSKQFGSKPFSYVHYLAVYTAWKVHQPDAIHFYYEYEPHGYWWEKAQKYLTAIKVQAPKTIFDRPLLHYAHQCDVFRLQTLCQYGGIYLDLDVISLKSLSPLRSYDVVMARQTESLGLCNAVILSKTGAPFLKRWLDAYHFFRSKGWDDYWDEHPVKVPYQIASEYPEEIHLEPVEHFFLPSWGRSDLLWETGTHHDFSSNYVMHLWESLWWNPYLKYLNPYQIEKSKIPFASLLRPLLKENADHHDAYQKFYNRYQWMTRLSEGIGWGRYAKRKLRDWFKRH